MHKTLHSLDKLDATEGWIFLGYSPVEITVQVREIVDYKYTPHRVCI